MSCLVCVSFFYDYSFITGSRNNVVSIVPEQTRQVQVIYLLCKTTRTALGPTKPPVKRVQAFFPLGKSGRSVRPIADFHLIPRLRIRGAILSLPSVGYAGVQFLNFHFTADTKPFRSVSPDGPRE